MKRPTNIGSAIDLTSVRMALSISEHRSLRRAASALKMSESAVSHRLRKLEETLTVSLFQRSSEGVEPTQAGLAFFQEAKEALRVLDSAANHAASASIGAEGKLVVGLYTSLSSGGLRTALAEFRKRHPNVVVSLTEGSRSTMVEGLRSGAIDVCVLIGGTDDRVGESLSLWREQLYAVLPASHKYAQSEKLTWPELEGQSFVVSTRDSGPESESVLMATLGGIGRRPSLDVHSVSCDTIREMVSLGFGATLAIESDLGRPSSDLAAIPLSAEQGRCLVPLVAYRESSNDNPPLRRFWSLLKTIRDELPRSA